MSTLELLRIVVAGLDPAIDHFSKTMDPWVKPAGDEQMLSHKI
jgi:hypothetical protein